jgi:cysteinyl-tRNA synthetase
VDSVLRLYDALTRNVEDVRPAHGRELRLLAVTPPAGPAPHLGQLRALLLPDLIGRCAERRGLVATVCEVIAPASTAVGPEPAGPEAAGPEVAGGAARGALNIHPPTRTAPPSEPIERTVEFVTAGRPAGGPAFDIGTGERDWLAGRELTRLVTAPTGAVTVDGRKVAADDAGAPTLAEMAARGLDPLTVRLVFLGQRYRDDADVTWETLFTAGKTLAGWRERVAEWALSPSAAILRRYADGITEAFDDDLDTPAALRGLHELQADDSAPAGAKFETFAAMDRLFGLDLARDIGKVTTARQA